MEKVCKDKVYKKRKILRKLMHTSGRINSLMKYLRKASRWINFISEPNDNKIVEVKDD